MLKNIKTAFYKLISSLGYNITDNGEYVEKFPWLMLRTNGNKVATAFNLKISTSTLVLDVFSKYPGEKEIIEIVENITNHLNDLYADSELLFAYQKSFKIIDDKSTGPVRKHGVVVYEFLSGYGLEEVINNGSVEA